MKNDENMKNLVRFTTQIIIIEAPNDHAVLFQYKFYFAVLLFVRKMI